MASEASREAYGMAPESRGHSQQNQVAGHAVEEKSNCVQQSVCNAGQDLTCQCQAGKGLLLIQVTYKPPVRTVPCELPLEPEGAPLIPTNLRARENMPPWS